MNQSTFIVTGATGVIGEAIVRLLINRAESDKHDTGIILACRNSEKAAKLISTLTNERVGHHIKLRFIALDLESFDSVRQFADIIRKEDIRITTLFNNAGTMPGKMQLTIDGHESATQVNYLATRMLTELLIDNIKEGGSVVFTTSLTRYFTRLHADWDKRSINHHSRFITYGRSKRLITEYAMQLSKRLAAKSIRINCSDPWIVDSSMITLGINWIDRLSDKLFRPLIHKPEQGAATAIKAALAPVTGKVFTS